MVRLRTFVEVYRQHSLSSAARTLNLTQPAVSQHIAGLEVAIGRPLFTRQASGVKPTAAADQLAADIGDKLDASELALSQAKARSLDVEGTLQVIGHSDFMAEVIAPHLLPLLDAGIRVRMHTGDGDFIRTMLLEGHCDLGFTAHPVIDKRLKSELVMSDPVYAVAAPSVVARLNLAPDLHDALMNEPMFTYNLELSIMENWLTKNRINQQRKPPALISQDLRALRGVLVQGVGWAVLPEYLCLKQIGCGELCKIPAPIADTTLNYHMAWAPSSLRTPRIAHARQTFLWSLQQGKR
ncbi:LysR family transcriptional regulator [Vibrio sp. PP-XX7]